VDDCRARDQEASNETVGMVLAIAGLGGFAAAGVGAVVAVVSGGPRAAAATPTSGGRVGSRSGPKPSGDVRLSVGIGPTGVMLQGSF
jgi:hypothetical protein